MTATADELIYLDNNATTQLDPSVIEEMLPFLMEHYGNPSSGYAFAARARKALDLAAPDQKADMLARMELYEAGKPYHEE